jgi:hypothetical protein
MSPPCQMGQRTSPRQLAVGQDGATCTCASTGNLVDVLRVPPPIIPTPANRNLHHYIIRVGGRHVGESAFHATHWPPEWHQTTRPCKTCLDGLGLTLTDMKLIPLSLRTSTECAEIFCGNAITTYKITDIRWYTYSFPDTFVALGFHL